jgi:hypothetical protein
MPRTKQEQHYWTQYEEQKAAQAELAPLWEKSILELTPEELARKNTLEEKLGLQPWQLRAAGISPYP